MHHAHALVEVGAGRAAHHFGDVEHVAQHLLHLRVLVSPVDVRGGDEAGDVVLQDGEPDAQRLAQVAWTVQNGESSET